MIKKNQEIEIDENDIFANDKLNRKDSIEDLSKLIISSTEPLVLSINASWGSGKTTFVKLWQTYLKKKCGVNSIYFSAWEDDFSKEPLISILGEMNNYIEKNFNVNTAVPKGFKKALNLTGKVLKRGVPIVIKGATAGLIDAPQIVEYTIAAISEESVKTLIENYSDDKNVLIKFKEAIEKVLNEMDEEKSFVIFIDELDRCRPLYSIELLERIKHVFGIKKLIFVLSIDKSQLCESIKSQYGNINANSYLKRFIDLEYTLSNPTINQFCDYLYERFEIDKILQSKAIEIKDREEWHHLTAIKKLANAFKLQLRDMEQIFTKIHMLLNIIEPKSISVYLKIIVFFEMLKTYDDKLYYNFINQGNTGVEIKKIVLPVFKDNKDDYVYNVYRDASIFFENLIDCTGKNYEEFCQLIETREKKLEEIKQNIDSENKSEVERLNRLIELLKIRYYDHNYLYHIIDNVIKKIEFADKFNFDTV